MLLIANLYPHPSLLGRIAENRNDINPHDFCVAVGIDYHNLYSKGLFHLFDTDLKSPLSFGTILFIVTSICLLERDDMIKLCFFVFDQHKNGCLDPNEFNQMLESLQSLDGDKRNDKVRYLVAKAKVLVWNEGKVGFAEIHSLFLRYPNLWFPCFQIQNKMMTRFMGRQWWRRKKGAIYKLRQEAKARLDIELQTYLIIDRMKMRRMKREIGWVRRYLTPWNRSVREVMSDSPVPRSKAETAKRESDADGEIHHIEPAWGKYLQEKAQTAKTVVSDNPLTASIR